MLYTVCVCLGHVSSIFLQLRPMAQLAASFRSNKASRECLSLIYILFFSEELRLVKQSLCTGSINLICPLSGFCMYRLFLLRPPTCSLLYSFPCSASLYYNNSDVTVVLKLYLTAASWKTSATLENFIKYNTLLR